MYEIVIKLWEGIKETGGWELIAVLAGIVQVVLARKEHIFNFVVGALGVSVLATLCYSQKLYANMGINIYYFFMGIYGWFEWSKVSNKEEDKTSITSLNLKEWLGYMSILIFSFIVLYVVLGKYTDSQHIFNDTITSSVWIIGMLLMAKKKIEHWIFWIIGDVIAVPLYFSAGLYFVCLQFVIFVGLAISGYFAWNKKLKVADR